MDTTAPVIGLSRDEFLANLTNSQLLGESEVQKFAAAHTHDDPLSLASALLATGVLTGYQLDAICQGRAKELRVGNYDILGRLGAGGMGTVFKARHRRMKRVVALKVLSSSLCKDDGFVKRFQREVETLARLGHPNIVMAYDADEAEVGHFLVMEFVDGTDLAGFVNKNFPLGVAVAVDCVVQAARGLAFAHAQGIIHRDIKPGNLLRDHSGVVKVTDLGLARLNNSEGELSAARGLTQTGGVLGTVDYMAPEQAIDSTAVDHRADIYSLGATLHFLLTGSPPFSGTTIMAVLLKHREAPIPSLHDARPDAPVELDAVLRRMMAKKPDDRFATMAEVVSALEPYAAARPGVPIAPSPAPPLVSSGSSVVIGTETTFVGTPQSVSAIVVEPSRVQAGIIRKYLEAQGVTTAATVGTGEAALAAVRNSPSDAVVSTLHLADMTGVELAKRIRSEVSARPPGFVLISSESDGADPSDLSRLDRVVLLPKPFTAEQLVQALNLVTGKSVTVKPGAGAVAGVPASGIVAKKPRAGARVLIVDDSATARVNERSVLMGLGFSAFAEAADGAQAIAAAAREPFDLIVTDYNMPLMDGYALVSYLKQTPATAGIPIVLVTTETAPAVLDPIRKLGVVAVFDKAFSAAAVKPVVDSLFA